ncbi:hypothetical protein HU200_049690 [Digitaria exilis]|uniref:Bifunctional inhibitor/plant lipid transfer protein/seed storage helical domain-containing protein n=1 Tax=Digitaria exilis TaxID=1010633 RepID=A0A835AUX6_9POAL|nr:hypothetical protein HU200_049690 [Digitaria exilis]CAB3499203.1 unnamed protein product [Digitaria exilis]
MARAVALLAALALALVAAGGAAPAQAQQCDATKLAVCAPAIIGGSAPTEPCCSALRAQEGCFCQYARDPAYSGYINSPNSRRALAACSIPVPHC